MYRGVALSAMLHLVLVALGYFGLPDLFSGELQQPRPIPVEVVTIAEETNAPPPEPEPEPEPDRPEPMPTVTEQPPPPPLPEPEMVETPPPPPLPEAEPEPKPEPPEPEPEVAAVPPEPRPEPPLRTKVRPKPRPPQPDQLASLLRNVEKLKDTIKREKAPEETRAETRAPEGPPVEYDPAKRITISERDAIRRHFEQCWNVPAGAREAENLVVEVEVHVNPDGWVREARILDVERTARDPFFRAAAESARRAVLNPSCRSLKPLNLPAAKYDLWKDMKISFNPKELLGS